MFQLDFHPIMILKRKIHLALLTTLSLGLALTGTYSQAQHRPAKRAIAPGQSVQTPALPAASNKAPALDKNDVSSANFVHKGTVRCGSGTDIDVKADPGYPGYFYVRAGNKSYFMRAVTSSTGAIRLQDDDAGVTWLQLGNKSMLLDQKNGRRIADDCVSPQQLEYAAKMNAQGQPRLLQLGPQ